MKSEELEQSLRTLWTRSQVPLNRDNLATYTGIAEHKLDKALARLVDRGSLRVEAVGGEMRWKVPGEVRPMDGPETLARFERREAMRAEARARVRGERQSRSEEPDEESSSKALARRSEPGDGGGRSVLRTGAGLAKSALGLVSSAAAPLDRRQAGGEKSLLLSAGLSLTGPLGWLYAGSFREAVPASALFLLIAWILPNPILWPLLWIALPVSALGGFAYAWQYNRKGGRTPLWLSSGKGEDEDE